MRARSAVRRGEPASPYYTLNQPFTVTGGNVLVVELSDRQNTQRYGPPYHVSRGMA